MAEQREWTAADDELVRGALATLRHDVDELPLADVRFVKARGRSRRRRTVLGWTSGAAAATLVAAVVGFSALGGDDGSVPVPPATTSATTPVDRQALSPYLREPGALPLAEEWKLALGWSSDFYAEPVSSYEADPCLGPSGGTPAEAESLLARGGNLQAAQTRWRAQSPAEAESQAASMAASLGSCEQGDLTVTGVQTSGWPRLYAYTAGDAGSGWYAVVLSGADLAVLNLVETQHRATEFTRAEVQRLASIAAERLERYADRPLPSTSTTTAPTPTVPVPLDEDMPVSGVQPLLPSSMFVAASQWTSPLLTDGQRAYAGPGDQEGSAAVVQCETDEVLAGVGGRYGIVSIRAGAGDANYIGKQRVRYFEDVQGYELVQADMARIDRLVMAGCSTGANRTTARRGPVQGTYLLTTRVGEEATGTMYQWVGVTGMQTEGAISTIVFHGAADGQGFTGTAEQGFAELLRLMDLARQK